MKRLLLVLVLLMTAGSLFAAELKVSGDMYVRGSTYSNLDLADTDEAMFSMFDYDLTVNAAFIANENATVFTRFAFDKNVDGSGYVADSTASSDDVGLALERAYINYKFAPFLQLNTGLMGGGQWASSFNDNEANVMRVQFIGALSPEMVFIATYEKRDDQGGALKVKDADDDDQTVYYLASRMKFNQITVLPLLIYGTQGIGNAGNNKALLAALNGLGYTEKNYAATSMGFQLGLNGDFGMFGFVSEFGYLKADTDGFADDIAGTPDAVLTGAGLSADQITALRSKQDSTVYGFMIDVFAKVDALKAGLIFAYGSADEEDGSFTFGDDFDLYYVMDDFVSNSATGLAGFTAFKLYGEYTMDKITAMAAFGYGYSNMKDDDASFMEFDLGASYAFDDATAYTVGFGYAKTSDFEVVDVDADAWRLFHKVSVKF